MINIGKYRVIIYFAEDGSKEYQVTTEYVSGEILEVKELSSPDNILYSVLSFLSYESNKGILEPFYKAINEEFG